jgi:hypothetical protein
MTFRPAYLVVAAALFAVEVAIARGDIPGTFVRHSVGDVLVIPLLHIFLRGVTRLPPWHVAAGVLAVAFGAEALQYVRLADRLGLAPGSIGAIVIGTTFSPSDLLMYCLGAALALALDVGVLARRQPGREAPARHP